MAYLYTSRWALETAGGKELLWVRECQEASCEQRKKLVREPKEEGCEGAVNGGFGPDPGECMNDEDFGPTISGHLVFLRGKKGEC